MSEDDAKKTDELALSDAELEQIFEQLHGHSRIELNREAQRAMAALQMIDRIRDLESSKATVRNDFDTVTDEPSRKNIRIPDQIGRFELQEVLGQGGFGIVYRAHDPRLHREVALKIPRAEVLLTQDLRRRFVREGKAAAALSHPNIVPVFESGTEGSICYLASELVRGETLEAWKTRQEEIAIRDAITVAKVLSEAIAHSH